MGGNGQKKAQPQKVALNPPKEEGGGDKLQDSKPRSSIRAGYDQ